MNASPYLQGCSGGHCRPLGTCFPSTHIWVRSTVLSSSLSSRATADVLVPVKGTEANSLLRVAKLGKVLLKRHMIQVHQCLRTPCTCDP